MDVLAAIRDPAFAVTPEQMRALLDIAGDAIEACHEDAIILGAIRDALEERGYFHMSNGRDIGALLDELESLRGPS